MGGGQEVQENRNKQKVKFEGYYEHSSENNGDFGMVDALKVIKSERYLN